VKRAVDVTGSALALLILWPLLLVLGALVKLDSPGPALFRPTVLGVNGHRFTLLKFRSMVANAPEVLKQRPELLDEYRRNLKVKQDPRITRVGAWLRRTSLDELPQLVNVLRGDLSLVGPRVLSDVEFTRYGAVGPAVLNVKPGLTGLWQVSGRHELSFERRVELDLQYIARASLWLDLVILCKTLPAVLSGRGAG
jgi:lipopolysaccharide/colanic/teichoic acid biosynthesis glycosyltransferase